MQLELVPYVPNHVDWSLPFTNHRVHSYSEAHAPDDALVSNKHSWVAPCHCCGPFFVPLAFLHKVYAL